MPKARPVPTYDGEKANAVLGPFAAPFAIGYTMVRMAAELSLFWADMIFVSRENKNKDEKSLPLPDQLEDKDEPELFA